MNHRCKPLASDFFSSLLDPLAGLLNRSAFFDAFHRTRGKSRAGALLMVDADHFKTINDTFGHLDGDEALKLIANAIGASVREQDIVGRIGGEEFGVWLPAATRQEAHTISERIRASVEGLAFHPDRSHRHPLTVSIGVTMTTGQRTAPQLLRQADLCLYQAKQRGRNAVVISGQQMMLP
jgi:diguanylate cyclase (GGDEF)-like protein